MHSYSRIFETHHLWTFNYHPLSRFFLFPFFYACKPNEKLLYATQNIWMGISSNSEWIIWNNRTNFREGKTIHWCLPDTVWLVRAHQVCTTDAKNAYLYLTRHDIETETNWMADRKIFHVTCALKITWYVPSMYHFILTTIQQLEIKLSISSEKY